MGGIGSGNWYQWDKRLTIEETNRIDIRYMRSNGLLEPGRQGSMNWQRAGQPSGSINYHCKADFIDLDYRYRTGDEWQPKQQRIRFSGSQCNYGGIRKWFECPKCERRVGLLCYRSGAFLCRHCQRLPYASQSEGKIDRLIRKKHKLGEQIFEDYDGEGWQRKKGMHIATFYRQLVAYLEIGHLIDDALADCWLGKRIDS